jgi:hypothetical protein
LCRFAQYFNNIYIDTKLDSYIKLLIMRNFNLILVLSAFLYLHLNGQTEQVKNKYFRVAVYISSSNIAFTLSPQVGFHIKNFELTTGPLLCHPAGHLSTGGKLGFFGEDMNMYLFAKDQKKYLFFHGKMAHFQTKDSYGIPSDFQDIIGGGYPETGELVDYADVTMYEIILGVGYRFNLIKSKRIYLNLNFGIGRYWRYYEDVPWKPTPETYVTPYIYEYPFKGFSWMNRITIGYTF